MSPTSQWDHREVCHPRHTLHASKYVTDVTPETQKVAENLEFLEAKTPLARTRVDILNNKINFSFNFNKTKAVDNLELEHENYSAETCEKIVQKVSNSLSVSKERATKMTEHFKFTQDFYDLAKKLGFSEIETETELRCFKKYWIQRSIDTPTHCERKNWLDVFNQNLLRKIKFKSHFYKKSNKNILENSLETGEKAKLLDYQAVNISELKSKVKDENIKKWFDLQEYFKQLCTESIYNSWFRASDFEYRGVNRNFKHEFKAKNKFSADYIILHLESQLINILKLIDKNVKDKNDIVIYF